jgi:general secretion pathway protein N
LAPPAAGKEVDQIDQPPASALEGASPVNTFAPAAAPPTSRRTNPATAANPLWAVPLRTLTATRERPLFSPSRRPPTPVIAAAPAPAPRPMPVALRPAPPEEPPFLLLGTIVSEDQKFAFLFNTNTKLVKRVKEGEQEDGWRVVVVDFRSSVVQKDERTVTLGLPKPGDTKPNVGGPNFGPRPATQSDNL